MITIFNKLSLNRLGQAAVLAVSAVVLSVGSLGIAHAQGMGALGGRGGHEMMMMMGDHIEHMLDMVDAGDAQRAQIKQIMAAAKQDLSSQHLDGPSMREQAQQRMSLLAAPNIDAAAVEALRQRMSAQHEIVSKRMSLAMVDAARVLTPEQRAKLAERMKKRQARMQAGSGEHQHSSGKGN